jgi:hypothetical protein
VVLEPREEGRRLEHLLGVERRGLLGELGDEVERALTHLRPVRHDGADVVDHA